jgi:hypothetical protein
MKKIILALVIVAAYGLPMVAQSDPASYPSENVALVSARIAGDVLPLTVSNSVNTRFDKDNPLTWSKFPYTLKEFGWVYEVGDTDKPLTGYEVSMRTSNNGFLTGVYNSEGELVETRERSKDIAVPQYILADFYEGEFKDWKIVGSKELVNFFQGKNSPVARQKFTLNIEKDKVRKKLAYNYEAGSGKLQAQLVK